MTEKEERRLQAQLRERIPLVSTKYGAVENGRPGVIEIHIYIPDIASDAEWHMEQDRDRDIRSRGTDHLITLTRTEGRCDEYPH